MSFYQNDEIFAVDAIDGDFKINDTIEYSIVSIVNDNSNYAFLDIDNNGSVSFNDTVLRKDYGADNYFTVTLLARETNCSALSEPCEKNTTTTLQILDINDNGPIIDSNMTYINITENYSGTLPFGQIIITDDDFDQDKCSFNLTM